MLVASAAGSAAKGPRQGSCPRGRSLLVPSAHEQMFVHSSAHAGWKTAGAQQLVREAMAERLVELEDIELILAGKKYRGRPEGDKTTD